MTQKQAKLLKPKLPAGWLALVGAKLEEKGQRFTYGMISQVKNAKKQNAAIEEALLEVAQEEVARREALTTRIAQLN